MTSPAAPYHAPGSTAPAVTASPAAPSIAAARALVAALVDLGVHDVVLSPGSRSAPLAYALADAADARALRLHVRVDERSAGFLALGLARGALADGHLRPVAVVTTSGTAVANLHPAVLEAHHGQVPLVVLTADRPHELRGTGANQTTAQVGIFGAATRLAADVPAPVGRAEEARDLAALAARAIAAATGVRSRDPGPVHLNLSYRDPLAPDADADADRGGSEVATVRAALVRTTAVIGSPRWGVGTDDQLSWPLDPRNTVVVAGQGAGPIARDLAEYQGWPLLAESVSGAAGGANLIAAHALVLHHAPIAREVERVIVVGRPTLSRPVQQLLARPGVEVIVLAPGGGPWPDAARNAAVVLPAIPGNWLSRARLLEPNAPLTAEPSGPPEAPSRAVANGVSAGWLCAWQDAGEKTAAAVTAHVDRTSSERLTGPAVAREVAAVLSAQDTLVVGSSNPVRDLDLVAAWREAPRVVANRGLAGIDGIVSTALGVALHVDTVNQGAASALGVVRALMGDLTFLHDVGGLLTAPGEPEPNLQIIVANDQGGSIFASLEHGTLAQDSTARNAMFERIFSTPHTANLGAICRGYGVRHVRVEDLAALRAVLAAPGQGVSVVEVRLDRSNRREDAVQLSSQIAAVLNH